MEVSAHSRLPGRSFYVVVAKLKQSGEHARLTMRAGSRSPTCTQDPALLEVSRPARVVPSKQRDNGPQMASAIALRLCFLRFVIISACLTQHRLVGVAYLALELVTPSLCFEAMCTEARAEYRPPSRFQMGYSSMLRCFTPCALSQRRL